MYKGLHESDTSCSGASALISPFLPLSALISFPYLTWAVIALDCSPFIQRLTLPLYLCFIAIYGLESRDSIEHQNRQIWLSFFFVVCLFFLDSRPLSWCSLKPFSLLTNPRRGATIVTLTGEVTGGAHGREGGSSTCQLRLYVPLKNILFVLILSVLNIPECDIRWLICIWMWTGRVTHHCRQGRRFWLTSLEGEKKILLCFLSSSTDPQSFHRCNLEKPVWKAWCCISTSAVSGLSSFPSFSMLFLFTLRWFCMVEWLVLWKDKERIFVLHFSFQVTS